MHQGHRTFPLMVNRNNNYAYTKQRINDNAIIEAMVESTNEEHIHPQNVGHDANGFSSESVLRFGPGLHSCLRRPCCPRRLLWMGEECKENLGHACRISHIQRTQRPHAAPLQAHRAYKQHTKSHAPSGPVTARAHREYRLTCPNNNACNIISSPAHSRAVYSK